MFFFISETKKQWTRFYIWSCRPFRIYSDYSVMKRQLWTFFQPAIVCHFCIQLLQQEGKCFTFFHFLFSIFVDFIESVVQKCLVHLNQLRHVFWLIKIKTNLIFFRVFISSIVICWRPQIWDNPSSLTPLFGVFF